MFEQFSNLNNFWIKQIQNFGFEQFFWIWTNFKIEQILDLNKFQIWTNFGFEQIWNLTISKFD
jgi:hypothetical protein